MKPEVGLGVVLVALFALIGAQCWAQCSAPCDSLGWMPVKELPARCLGTLR